MNSSGAETASDGAFPNAWTAPGLFFEGTHYLLRNPTVKNNDLNATVVLVHGIGSYFASFGHVADELLGAGYSTLQYDFYGRGFSKPSPTSKYDEHIHINQLESLLTYLRERGEISEKIHIVGHSMGGAFVTLFAAHLPAVILSVTLCTPAGLMRSWALGSLNWFSPMESLLKPIIIGKSQMIRASLRDFHLNEGVYAERREANLRQMVLQADNNPHIFEAMWKCLLHFPLNDISTRVKTLSSNRNINVLVLWAQYDQMIPMGYNLKAWESAFEEGNCKWRSAVVENSGHMFIVEQYEKVSEEILQHLRETEQQIQASGVEEAPLKADEAIDAERVAPNLST